eukprot:Em0007g1112a
MQHLLDRCSDFTEWAHLMFNTKKCASLFMVNSVSPIFVDLLFTPRLRGDAIPALTWDQRYKYLGCPTGAHHHNDLSDLGSLCATLVKDSTTVFESPLAEWQKHDAFRLFLFPRVSFVLKVMFPGSISFHKLDTTLRGSSREASRSHLEPARNISIFLWILEEWAFLCRGRAHIARVTQAFTFLADQWDPTIRAVALHQLAATMSKRAKHLDPTNLEDMSIVLSDTSIAITTDLAQHSTPSHHLQWHQRKLASIAAREGAGALRLKRLTVHTDQTRAFPPLSLHPVSSYFMYSEAFMSFYQYRFIHKARLDLLPVRTVQARCRKPIPSIMCGRFHWTKSWVYYV